MKVHNLAPFCREIGCTIPGYRGIVRALKQRKVELSNERLGVEDELVRQNYNNNSNNYNYNYNYNYRSEQQGKASEYEYEYGGGWERQRRQEQPPPQDTAEGPSFSLPKPPDLSSWLPSFPNPIEEFGKNYNNNNNNENNNVLELEKRRQVLSDRAIAIQNLLATLQNLEERTTPNTKTSPKELADLYRTIARTEGIDAAGNGGGGGFAPPWQRQQQRQQGPSGRSGGTTGGMSMPVLPEAPDWMKRPLWTTTTTTMMPKLQPRPPPTPPTMQQFMNQCLGDDSTTDTGVPGAGGNKGHEEPEDSPSPVVEWFGGTRATANPFSTDASAAASAAGANTNNRFSAATAAKIARRFGGIREATGPFSAFARNSTSASVSGDLG